jgi:hypothetical protein
MRKLVAIDLILLIASVGLMLQQAVSTFGGLSPMQAWFIAIAPAVGCGTSAAIFLGLDKYFDNTGRPQTSRYLFTIISAVLFTLALSGRMPHIISIFAFGDGIYRALLAIFTISGFLIGGAAFARRT